jgi:hypothetical protein
MHAKPTDEQLANRFIHHPPFGDQTNRYEAIRGEDPRDRQVHPRQHPVFPGTDAGNERS